MGRILGIDFGSRRIGISLSDPLKIIATPHTVIDRQKTPNYISELKNIITSFKVDSIVVGLPFNMKGNESAQTKDTMDFISELKQSFTIKIHTTDERLSSKSAEDVLKLKGISVSKNRDDVDKTAAAIILQEFLDSHKT